MRCADNVNGKQGQKQDISHENLPKSRFSLYNHSRMILRKDKVIPSLGKFATPAAAGVAAVLAAVCRFTVPADAMPQKSDSDPLAILFGDMRMLIGRRMVEKADEYFHGGVTDIGCELNDHHHDHVDGDGHHEEDDDHHHEDDAEENEAVPVSAPWAFVTRAIRLPSVERHLEGESSREILPWLWVALRVDSKNASAYSNAAYVLDSLYGDKDKSLAVLEEGIATNPESAELEFQKGALLLHGFKAPAKAEAAFRAALAKAPRDRQLENREDVDAPLLMLRALFYLGKLASDRDDGGELRRCYEMAHAINPNHNATKSLGKLINQ